MNQQRKGAKGESGTKLITVTLQGTVNCCNCYLCVTVTEPAVTVLRTCGSAKSFPSTFIPVPFNLLLKKGYNKIKL